LSFEYETIRFGAGLVGQADLAGKRPLHGTDVEPEFSIVRIFIDPFKFAAPRQRFPAHVLILQMVPHLFSLQWKFVLGMNVQCLHHLPLYVNVHPPHISMQTLCRFFPLSDSTSYCIGRSLNLLSVPIWCSTGTLDRNK